MRLAPTPNHARFRSVAGVLALLSLLVSAIAAARGGERHQDALPEPGDTDLVIAFTAGMLGNLEPCGCTESRWGGLARRASAIDALRARYGGHVLILDAGSQARGGLPWEQVNFTFAMRGLAAIGAAAANVGRMEQLFPGDALRSAARESRVPLVSLNVSMLDGSPIDRRHTVAELAGKRILITGVADPLMQAGGAPALTATDPTVAAASFARELPSLDHDLSILLADTDERTLERLARAAPEFDLIIGGNVPQPSPGVSTVGRASIVYAAGKAKVLGIVGIHDAQARSFTAQTLDNSVPERRDMLDLVEAYNDELRRTVHEDGGAALGHTSNRDPVNPYAGSADCLDCHSTTAQVWSGARHAHALDTLSKINRAHNPDCLSCHTVGLGRPGGFVSARETPHLGGVGCESCHGAGGNHIAALAAAREGREFQGSSRFRPATAEGCITCHDPENSPNFDYETYWPKIRHGHEPSYE